jgi:hypothetical protein
MKRHELCACYPVLGAEQLRALAEDIRVNGQSVPIEIFEGAILDGWNRYLACQIAKVKPWIFDKTSELQGVDLVDYVISRNALRRHLSVQDRAVCAANLMKTDYFKNRAAASQKSGLKHGKYPSPPVGRNMKPSSDNQSAKAAAKATGASTRSTERAARVNKAGIPEVIKAMEVGDISLAVAEQIVKRPKKEQKKLLDEALGIMPKPEPTDMETEAKAIRSWCTRIVRMIDELPDSPWFYQGHIDIIKGELKSAAAAARSKIGLGTCPKCNSNGCKYCRQTGWLPKNEMEHAGLFKKKREPLAACANDCGEE